jgi:hypothetical protein
MKKRLILFITLPAEKLLGKLNLRIFFAKKDKTFKA